MVRSWGPTPADGNDRLPNHPTRQRGAAVSGGMVENRSFEMSVEMLSPSSAGEVCGADAGRYNTGAVLPQGASDVQSIRTSQTADPRSKQTHPSGPARRSARVNSRPGDGDSPGSMPAVRLHWGEVVESFLRQPLLAGLPPPAAALPRASPPRTLAAGGWASTSRQRPSSWSICARSNPWATCSTTGWLSPAPTSTHWCPTARTSTSSSASRKGGATDVAASSYSASWRWTTSSPVVAVSMATAR